MKTITRILTFTLLSWASLFADVPLKISYQGLVYDSGGAVLNPSAASNRKVIFRIWDQPSGGNRLWTEEQAVTIYKGEFSVLLGTGYDATGSEAGQLRPSLNEVFSGTNTERYLEIMVDSGDNTINATDRVISPRQTIGTAAFAIHAKTAEGISNNNDFNITPNAGLGYYSANRTWTNLSINGPVLYGTDSGVLGTETASNTQKTALFWNSSGQVGIGATSSFGSNSTKLVLQADDTNATASQLVIRGDTDLTERLLIGFDTSNSRSTLQSYTASSTTGPLLLNPSGGNVGIGVVSPAIRLSVDGAIGATGAGGHVFGTSTTSGLFSPSESVVTLKTSGNVRLRADNEGRVSVDGKFGIGTTTPTAKLTINDDGVSEGATFGSVQINRAASGHTGSHLAFIRQGQNDCGLGYKQSDSVFGFGDGHEGAAFNPTWLGFSSSGNIGINTAPLDNYRLTVNGMIHAKDNIVLAHNYVISGLTVAGVRQNAFWPRGADDATYLNYGAGGLFIRDNSDNPKMQITPEGYVKMSTGWAGGILNVGKRGNSTIYINGYLDTNGGQSGDSNTNRQVSVQAEGMLLGEIVAVYSDARIKTDLHVSDTAKDLETLMDIEITDYHYKDKVASNNGPQKKVIAQQVEKVYPQAVSQISGLVPDVFKKAAVKDGWVELASDLKKGDRVKLIGKKAEAIHEVLEIRDGAFRPDGQVADEQVFVYGREVKDFRTVDYDAIAMLNVSATQELARKLQAENAALRHELAEQEKRATANSAVDAAQNARLVALEKLLTEKSGVPQTVSIKAGE